MSENLIETDNPLWRRLVECKQASTSAFHDFCSGDQDRIPSLRHGLRSPGVERMTALQVIPYLELTERMRLFSDLVWLASSAHGSIHAVRQIILSLPRDWTLKNIEQEAERHLRDGTYDEYRRFLELYEMLDRDLTLKLGRRAAAHPDPDVREAGDDYLEKLLGARTQPREN